jgi:predicted 3-demethylubiquinone-9 3-methyltransferase (glyoxalase superfamily)
MPKFVNCLWFDSQAEDAVKHYTGIFPRSKITATSHYPEGSPAPKPAGSVMTVEFELDGQPFVALNGGPEFKFTPAVSIMVKVETQDELDKINTGLLAGGGEQLPCGWVTDRFGLSWQVVPRFLDEVLGKDDARSKRLLAALWQMRKLDIAALKKAYEGG